MFVNVTKDNVIVDEDSFETHQGEYNVTTCYFTFSEEFNSLVKIACFTINSTNETYKIDIVDNECSIPAEVLEKEFETITLGVYGYTVDQSDNLELRYSPTSFDFYVERGSYKEGGETPEIITPTQYELYSQKLQEGLDEIANLDIDAKKVEHTTTITITKKDGNEKTVEILDGEKGEKGDKGDTPVKGTDYYTAADKAELEATLSSDVTTEVSSQLSTLTSATPLAAASTDDFTDTTRIYVLTTDGHWYWYDGDSWEDGGEYQAAANAYDKTLTINNAVPNSKDIGDKINNNVYRKNYLSLADSILGKKYDSYGALSTDDRFLISNVIKLKTGDTIHSQYFISSLEPRGLDINAIIKVDAYGDFSELITPSNSKLWTADEDCFIKVQIQKSYSYIESLYNIAFAINTPINRVFDCNYRIVENNNEINQISRYKNLFDVNDYCMGTIKSDGSINNSSGYFVTPIIDCKIGDVIYLNSFDANIDTLDIKNVMTYDTNCHFIERINYTGLSYTCSHNGYVRFNVRTNSNPSTSSIVLSKNEQLSEYISHTRIIDSTFNERPIKITKIDATNYKIKFGNFAVTLFRNVNQSTNSDNWNLKEISDLYNNVIIPQGTDILGPVKINDNDDFIGGVHGDETTTFIKVAINNQLYSLDDISEIEGENAKLIMVSTCYDESTKDATFERYVIINFSYNKIKVSNSYKALATCTLKRATNGGLIACRNNIINNIVFNNMFYSTPPTTQQNIKSHENTSATVNTIYGSITVNNLKGYESPNYTGYIYVFENETPIRCKIYFDTYKNGNYPISAGDVINGEFEYLLS